MMCIHKPTIAMILLVAVATFAKSCFAADATTGPLDHFLANTNTFQARFVQTVINKDGETQEQLSGTLKMRRPGQLYWLYEKPYLQHIVINADTLWFYDDELKQVIIKKMTDAVHQTPAAIILGYKKADLHFNATELGLMKGRYWVELTPHDPETTYSRVRIGFDGKELDVMLLFDTLDQVTRIDFLDQKQNEVIDANLFHFTPPAGVDIFDERDTNGTIKP